MRRDQCGGGCACGEISAVESECSKDQCSGGCAWGEISAVKGERGEISVVRSAWSRVSAVRLVWRCGGRATKINVLILCHSLLAPGLN